jgi:transcriptional regulator with GAF, ATPase, and Fis domain
LSGILGDSEPGGPSRTALVRALELARALAGSRDPDAVLDAILDSAIELTGAERGFVVAPDPSRDGGGLVVRAARNYGRRGVPLAEARVSETVVRRALESGRVVRIASAGADQRFGSVKSVRSLKLRSVLVAPLLARGATLGAVLLEDRSRKDAFTEAHAELVELVAAHAALALEAARARTDLERRSAEVMALNERLERRLARAESSRAVLARELETAREAMPLERRLPRLMGSSEPMNALRARVTRYASVDHPVLIQGESGSGKELVARMLHEHGNRSGERFLAINVTELPESLLESELFGHAKGAFTGAASRSAGLLREADGGTIFLDEIADTSVALQAKLLRFLQERTVRAVGDAESVPVDVRILAGTSRDLRALIRSQLFREDLLFRLNVLTLEVPPLRERPGDVRELASSFLVAAAAREKTKPRRLSREAVAALEAHSWPGNVRELENAIRRAIVVGSDPIQAEDLDLGRAPVATGPLDLDDLSRDAAQRALDGAKGSVARAAALLGIHRATLYRKLQQWGLRS